MSELAAQHLEMALGLSAAERAELACSLIESLDQSDEESVQAAWDAEIVRRMEDLKSGKIKLVSLAEARRRLCSSLD
jgi:putative addiction module component (TIGR02574 family)